MDIKLGNSTFSSSVLSKQSKPAKLNLVALMDIFTILVFFLLLNSGDADKLQKAKFVSLPNSTAHAAPHVEATIIIDEEEIWLNDELIVSLKDLKKADAEGIQPLAEALVLHREKKVELTPYEKEFGLSVTIMGDKSVSFSLLEKVMSTCSSENFRDISLAVNKVSGQPSEYGSLLSSVSTSGRVGG